MGQLGVYGSIHSVPEGQLVESLPIAQVLRKQDGTQIVMLTSPIDQNLGPEEFTRGAALMIRFIAKAFDLEEAEVEEVVHRMLAEPDNSTILYKNGDLRGGDKNQH